MRILGLSRSLFDRAEIEMDEPREDRAVIFAEENQTKEMSASELKDLEQIKDRRFHRLLQEKGFSLLLGILMALIVFYAADVVLINLGLKNSANVSAICELFKFIASSLVGFIFATKSGNVNDE
jgi:hypothetical protein